MDQLTTNARFHRAINNFHYIKKNKIYNIFEKMIEENPNLSVSIYIAILDKLNQKDISFMDISGFTYMKAVEIWNNYILNSQENLDLLITKNNLLY